MPFIAISPRRRHAVGSAAAWVLAIALALLAACAGSPPSTPLSQLQQRQAIDADVDAALARSRANPAARALIDHAAAVMVFPTLVQADPFVDEQAGLGELRVANVVTAYFFLRAPLLRQRARSSTVIIVFADVDMLNRYAGSTGRWRIGYATPEANTGPGVFSATPPGRQPRTLVFDGAALLDKPVFARMDIEALAL